MLSRYSVYHVLHLSADGKRGKVKGSPKLLNFILRGDMNVCTKFYGNPSYNYRDISLKTTNVNFMMALEESSGESPKPAWFILTNVCTTFRGNPSDICRDISVWTKTGLKTSPPILLALNLLEWWQCCLVHAAASLWCANSHIVSFFIWTLCENCTCINKPTAIRIKQQHQGQAWILSQLGRWKRKAIGLLTLQDVAN